MGTEEKFALVIFSDYEVRELAPLPEGETDHRGAHMEGPRPCQYGGLGRTGCVVSGPYLSNCSGRVW